MPKTKSVTVLNSCLSPQTWIGVCLRYLNLSLNLLLNGLNFLWCILAQHFWQNSYKKIVPETKAEPETLSYNHSIEVRNYLLPSVKSNKDSKDIVTTQHFIKSNFFFFFPQGKWRKGINNFVKSTQDRTVGFYLDIVNFSLDIDVQ